MLVLSVWCGVIVCWINGDGEAPSIQSIDLGSVSQVQGMCICFVSSLNLKHSHHAVSFSSFVCLCLSVCSRLTLMSLLHYRAATMKKTRTSNKRNHLKQIVRSQTTAWTHPRESCKRQERRPLQRSSAHCRCRQLQSMRGIWSFSSRGPLKL